MNNEELDLSKLDELVIRPVENGFVVTLRTEDGEPDYVFDSHQKTIRFVKKLISAV